MKSFREISTTKFFDKENDLFIKFVPAQDYKSIESFCVSLLSVVKGKPTEIIRFDSTKREGPNVHRFYNKPPTKQYLNKEKNFKTVEECIEDIEKNWRKYLQKYRENHT